MAYGPVGMNFGAGIPGMGGATGYAPSGAPIGYTWGGPTNTGGIDWANIPNAAGSGSAGTYAYDPSIAGAPAAWQAPTYSNTMSNWLGGGAGSASDAGWMSAFSVGSPTFGSYGANPNAPSAGASEMRASTPAAGNAWTLPGAGSAMTAGWDPSGWDPMGVGYQQTQRLNMGAQGGGAYMDPYSGTNWGSGGGGGGGSGRAYPTGMGGGGVANTIGGYAGNAYQPSPYGTSTGNWATWPNPGANLSSYDRATWNMLAGIAGAEGGPANNPYMVTASSGYAVPQNAGQSAATAGYMLNNPFYPYPGQAASRYNQGPGNVNLNYNPNVPGSTPYKSNIPTGANVTPQQYLYGNPSSGYPGFYSGMTNSATNAQFQNAAATPSFGSAPSAGQGFANSWWPGAMGQGMGLAPPQIGFAR